MRRFRNDSGSLSLYVAILAVPILLLAGLVIDGGGALVAKQRAADQAEQAARAGANAIDIAVLRDSGNKWLNCADATGRVQAYRAQSPADDYSVVSCDVNRIEVMVEVKYQSIILGRTFTMRQAATASPICETDQLCSGP